MAREMIINATVRENVRVAILLDGKLWDYFEDSQVAQRTRGNIYLGRIAHVQPSLGACFVDYGEARQGLLPLDDFRSGAVLEQAGEGRIQPRNGLRLLVQVEKEPVDQKGARLTCDISLAGRHLVLTPFAEHRGVSRKIEDEQERERTRRLAEQLSAPRGMGLIVRTVAAGQNLRPLRQDLNYLVRMWQELLQRARKQERPGLLHAEVALVQRLLRDYYSNQIERVWVDEREALEEARRFFRLFAPRQQNRLLHYQEQQPIFARFAVEEQIEAALGRRVPLPSGGSLVVEPTEALVAIDVNSGKTSGRDPEQTALETNLEAAEEVARQLRLRNLGGIVVIDFIDMEKAENQRRVEQRLREAMKEDKARHRLGKISAFGLCLLTRQRLEQPLRTVGQRRCPVCQGSGVVRSLESLSLSLLRRMEAACSGGAERICLRLPCDLANYLQGRFRQRLAQLEREHQLTLEILAEPGRGPEEVSLEFQARAEAKPAAAASPSPSAAPPAGAESHAKRRRRRRRRKKSAASLTAAAPADGGEKA